MSFLTGSQQPIKSGGLTSDIFTTGQPTNLSDLFKSATEIANRNITDQVAALGESLGPQGLRFSTDRLRSEALLRERGAQDLNSFIINAAVNASEAAKNRALSATQVATGIRSSALQSVLASLGVNQPPILPSGAESGVAAALPGILAGIGSSRAGGKNQTKAISGLGGIGSPIGDTTSNVGAGFFS